MTRIALGAAALVIVGWAAPAAAADYGGPTYRHAAGRRLPPCSLVAPVCPNHIGPGLVYNVPPSPPCDDGYVTIRARS